MSFFETIPDLFTNMVGTVAVILLIAAIIGSTDAADRLLHAKTRWTYVLLIGGLGGLFGMYGNLSGVNVNGAVISVRDIGPMLAGYAGGPFGGLIAGVIAGAHRLYMGGLTAPACVVATCSIGLICGLISWKRHSLLSKPWFALIVAAAMEAFHLGVVLLMVKPFETALDIVKQIAAPFILVNAAGFALMMAVISNTERQRRITTERNRLQSELEVANVIQHSLLPTLGETYPGRPEVDVSASMEAAKEVGGDFYDVFFMQTDRLAFVVGDVSGKGVPAALFMANAKITLQNCLRDVPEPAKAVEIANNALCARNEADMFVTIWVGVLDLRSGELCYVSAGHNPPVILRGDRAEYLKTKNGFVMAGMEGVKYREFTTTLGKGDTLFLYTDGVTEAQTRENELYGEERLLECLQNARGESADGLIGAVRASVEAFAAGNEQFDDMTMLCVRYNGVSDAGSEF